MASNKIKDKAANKSATVTQDKALNNRRARAQAEAARVKRMRLIWGAGALGVFALILGLLIYNRPWEKSNRPAKDSSGAIATLETSDFHSLSFSPTDPNLAYFGHHNGLLRSTDGGYHWAPLIAKSNFDAMGMAINRTNGQQIFLAGPNVTTWLGH